MELLFLFIGLPLLIGIALAVMLSGVALFGSVAVVAVSLAIRFWYISIFILGALLSSIIYINGWVGYAILGTIVFLILVLLTPLNEEQKAELERLKKASN